MTFASSALNAHQQGNRAVGVSNLFNYFPWKFMLVMRFGAHIFNFGWKISIWYILWLLIRTISIELSWIGCGDGQFAASTDIKEYILSKFLRLTSALGSAGWAPFWHVYFIFASDKSAFIADYRAAWRQKPDFNMEIVLFTNNRNRIKVPVPADMDDKALLGHLRIFYDLARARRGLFEFLGAKSSDRIEIVHLETAYVIGSTDGAPLALGRHGSYGQQISLFKNPSRATGTAIGDRLKPSITNPCAAWTLPGHQTHALNIVRRWDPNVTTFIVMIPIGLSLVIAVLWSVIATKHFGQDVQASTQTAFTIGSYVVTSGTLLIALVAFLDSKFRPGE